MYKLKKNICKVFIW